MATVTILEEGRRCIGHGLLGPNWGQHCDWALNFMSVAYATISEVRSENFGIWQIARQKVTETVKQTFEARGLGGPPFNMAALWARIDRVAPAADPNEHMNMIRALLTDFTETFSGHIVYRLYSDGNVHLKFVGPTGMAKSSCAVYVADWIKPIPPEQLESRLSFDVGELPLKLKNIQAGETVIQDEFIAQSGEGARTFASLFENLEDTLRASQKNLFVCSPREHEHATMQATLEAIAWNPDEKFTVFLVWLEGQPHGVVAIPWMRAELYSRYKEWKTANTDRAVSGQFKDMVYIVRTALRVFEDPRFVEYLTITPNKPTKTDFETALMMFYPQTLSGGQVDRIVQWMYATCYGFKRMEPHISTWWPGCEANDGLRKVALRCNKG